MNAHAAKTWNELCEHVRRTSTLASVESLLGWDEHTMLPAAGHEHRAEQSALLAGLIHERSTDRRIGEWLAEIETAGVDDEAIAATLREIRREYDRDSKLPTSLVEELARVTVEAQHAWVEARAADDYSSFQPHLERIVALKRQEAEALGYEEQPYDALLEEYEPGQRASRLAPRLAELRDQLAPLVRSIVESPRRPNPDCLRGAFPAADQEVFGKRVAAAIGFDFRAGRLDVTAHPFCSTIGPGDCRLTTRYDEAFFPSGLFSILHEAGHGLYEQGLRREEFGLPLGEAVSLGVHESQSRLWENLVGRSRPFWEHFFPQAQAAFSALRSVALDDFYFAINEVRPSLIRVEADEATYNLHILVRFELEQDLISGALPAGDLPAAWNEKYQAYLGIAPPNHADGALQDIHWSAGLIGYFPTYTLGNLYASQLFEAAERELGPLAPQFLAGEFAPLLDWLRRNIHQQGKRYPAETLVERITGEPASPGALMRHLRSKLRTLYGIA